MLLFFFFSSRRRHTRCSRDWSSDVCSSDLYATMRWIAVITGDSPDRVTVQGFLGVLAARQERQADALAFDRTLQAMNPTYLYGRHTMWRGRRPPGFGGRDTAGGVGQGGVSRRGPRGGGLHPFSSP